ncbi:TetR/AcrR family transcriptional regulator [Anaeromassilibacillus sp. Marseille-P3371]|uniref:TetR/AcrR family transcriptional regulator n=1 Tax=Anaeromassilibacillus sp. Marseille-P3371 TaxID=1944639 RepID=UPI000A1CA449|nr:TetR/AcrR family transcriptional regulator [Anaeromassilibacillus sp. Marseille-P3371]
MAKRVEGVTEKLLESAKNEFLKNGYENASLQSIAEKAGSSKGAIYIRYPDKKSLYCALVKPTADEFCNLLEGEFYRFEMLPSEKQKEKIMTFGDDGFSKVIAYIYDHFDEFKLILTSGENSTYQEFIHRIIELDISCTMQFIEQTGNNALSSGRLTPELAHLLSSAFYAGVFEVVIHDMPQDQAVEHIQRMRRFYNAGWKTIFEGNAG